MLNSARILVLEDEPMIALDLTTTVEDADGVVVGPVNSVAKALAILNGNSDGRVDAAVLDVNLLDGEVTPVALLLLKRAVPFLIHSAVGLPNGLRTGRPYVPLYMKPCPPRVIVQALFGMIRGPSTLLH